MNQKDADIKISHYDKLDKIYKDSLLNPNTVLIISDISIKNNVILSILHICREQNIITKTIYLVINVTSTKAELFTIRCGIYQVIQLQDVNHIIIITDAISTTR